MKELDTMKQLEPHPYVIKLLGCVTQSGMLWLCGFILYIFLANIDGPGFTDRLRPNICL